MTPSCEQIKNELTDVHYGEKPMTEALRRHLKQCPECADHWAALLAMDTFMAFSETEDPFREIVLEKLLAQSKEPRQTHRPMDLFLFLLSALVFLGTALLLAFTGKGRAVASVYAVLFLFSPILLPFMIRHQLAKEA